MRDTVHFLSRDHRRCGTEHRSLLQLDGCTLGLIKVSWKCIALVKVCRSGVKECSWRRNLSSVWKSPAPVKYTCRVLAGYSLLPDLFTKKFSETKHFSASLWLWEHFVSHTTQPPSNSFSLAWLTAVKRKTETEAILTANQRSSIAGFGVV